MNETAGAANEYNDLGEDLPAWMIPLNHQERLFVRLYCKVFNQREAAALAGYARNEENKTRQRRLWDNHAVLLMNRAEIQKAIRNELGQRIASAEECTARITARARASMRHLYKVEMPASGDIEDLEKEPTWDVTQAFRTGMIDCVKKIRRIEKTFKDGTKQVVDEVELYDAQEADITILRVHNRLAGGSKDEETQTGDRTIFIEYVDKPPIAQAPDDSDE